MSRIPKRKKNAARSLTPKGINNKLFMHAFSTILSTQIQLNADNVNNESYDTSQKILFKIDTKVLRYQRGHPHRQYLPIHPR